jgi:DNA-binding NarL/FixJ family response regulator
MPTMDKDKASSPKRGMPKPSVRILIVDDHSLLREGLSALLERGKGITVVGSVASGEEAVLAARLLKPDVIIMDLVLPALNGIDAARSILLERPVTRIIVLSGYHTSEHVYRALRAGALAYVLKTSASEELLSAVNAVTAGEHYVSPAITAQFDDGALSASIPKSPFDRLSARERDVLRHVVAGSTSSDIALRLSLSPKTVDTYRGRMMVKLGVANRSELIRLALAYELPIV